MLGTKTALTLLAGFIAATQSGFSQANFWEQTGGPQSVHLTVLAMKSPDSIYAGTRKGILRSTNRGDSWQAIGLADIFVESVLFTPGGYVFAGTSTGLYRSSNEGVSWDTLANGGLPGSSVSSLAVHPGGDLFAGCSGSVNLPGGLFRSTDSGEHWTQVLIQGRGLNVNSLAIDREGRIFVVDNGLYRSTDNCTTWTYLNVTAPAFTADISKILAVSVSGVIYAGTAHAEVAHSTDHGGTWSLVGTGYSVLSIVNQDTLIAGTGLGSVVRSTNGSLSWTEVAVWNRADVLLAGPGGLVFGGYHTIFRSTNNGESWSGLDTPGWRDVEVHSLAAGNGDTLYAGGADGLFCSEDNGNSWRELNMGGVENSVDFLAVNSRGHVFAYMAAMHGALYRSTDNGEHWVSRGRLVYPAIDGSDRIFALGGFDGPVVRSTDNGESWDTVYTPAPGEDITSLVVDIHSHIFVGTDGGGMYRSIDNGSSWRSVNNGLSSRRIWNLATSARGDIFAGTDSNVVFVSTDDGRDWTGQYSLPSWIIAMAANAQGDLFAAVSGLGVYRNGSRLIGGLTDLTALSLAVDHRNYLFVGTVGSSVFRSVQPSTALNGVSILRPATIKLEQNYPNPFNPATTIRFDLPNVSHVKLTVFDVLGREVSLLVNERREAGVHEVGFDGSNLASGLYFYRLQAGDYVATKKFLLLK